MRSRVRFNQEFNWVVSGSMDGTVIVYDYDVNRVRAGAAAHA